MIISYEYFGLTWPQQNKAQQNIICSVLFVDLQIIWYYQILPQNIFQVWNDSLEFDQNIHFKNELVQIMMNNDNDG